MVPKDLRRIKKHAKKNVKVIRDLVLHNDQKKTQNAKKTNFPGFAAGTRTFTVADLALLATYSSAKESGAFELSSSLHPQVEDWFLRMKSLVPSYHVRKERNFLNMYR